MNKVICVLGVLLLLWSFAGTSIQTTGIAAAGPEGLAPCVMTACTGMHQRAMLNANLATREQLEGAADAPIADAIIAERPFLTLTALYEALEPLIGDERTRALFASVSVPINLNTASREEILLIPGVGNRMAHEFEEYRPYKAMAQFRREIGKYVDDDEVARLEQFVFVPINLNTASREEILLIPGVGNRMAHEFEEYRPYTSMAQFRREIGKYVDDKEVARLERFVTL